MTDSITTSETCRCGSSTTVTTPATRADYAKAVVASWRGNHWCSITPGVAGDEVADDPEPALMLDSAGFRAQVRQAWEAREETITPMRGAEVARHLGVAESRARAIIAEWRAGIRPHVVREAAGS